MSETTFSSHTTTIKFSIKERLQHVFAIYGTQKIILASFLLTYFSAVLLRDPNIKGSFPICPFLYTTGCFCPGCGSMRATRAALLGNFGESLSSNILLLPVLLFFIFWLVWPKKIRIPINIGLSFIVIAVIFAVVRNFSFGSFLAP